MKNLAKAVVGLLLVFVVHIPKLLFLALLISYAAVFENRPTLTADPAEHLKRARKILRRGRLSELLYAAIEIRFALEQMAQRELLFAESASRRMRKEYDASKKDTGKRIKWGEYKPLDKARVAAIQGRLGDLLHPKDGLLLGVPDDPWYVEARRSCKTHWSTSRTYTKTIRRSSPTRDSSSSR